MYADASLNYVTGLQPVPRARDREEIVAREKSRFEAQEKRLAAMSEEIAAAPKEHRRYGRATCLRQVSDGAT